MPILGKMEVCDGVLLMMELFISQMKLAGEPF